MSQPNSTWNPSRGPRNHHPQGRGRNQASSDKCFAPQTLLGQDKGSPGLPQGSQRQNDPVDHYAQSTPYWDDSNGAIHEIPGAPPRNSAPSSTQSISGEPRSTQIQQQGIQLQTPPQSEFNNPYLDVVGEGPYGQNRAMYTITGIAQAKSSGQERKSNKGDFIPYFDAADTRNSTDLKSSKRYSSCAALGAEDVNRRIRQETTDAIRAADTKRGKASVNKLSKSRLQPILFSRQQPPTTPTTFKSKFEFPTSPKMLKQGAASTSQSVTHQWPGTLSPVVEAPSPCKVADKNQPNPSLNHKRTSTLDRILALRAEEQAKALLQLEGGLQKGHSVSDNKPHAPRAPPRRASDSASQRIAKHTSREEQRRGSEFVAGPGLLESQQWKDICVVADSVVAAELGDASRSSSVYSGDDNAQQDEIDRLSKAIVGLRLFHDLSCPSPDNSGFQRKSAVPVGLDMSKIGAGKGEPENGAGGQHMQRAPCEETLDEAKTELLGYFGVTDRETGRGSVQPTQELSSTESSATASSEGYEKVGGKEEELVTEQNGGRRQWYKGFRRV